MKKTAITLLIILSSALSLWAGKPEKLERLARQYKDVEGFEMVNIGKLGMSLMKGIVNLAGDLDSEERTVLKSFKGIKGLTIIDFEDIPEERKQAFSAKVERILNGMEVIMEAKGDGDAISIYGIEKGGHIRDCVLYSKDGVLLVAKGLIPLNQLGGLIEMAQ